MDLPLIIQQKYVLLESSAAQSGLPLLRQLIEKHSERSRVLLVCLLYSPKSLLVGVDETKHNLDILDLTDNVPDYSGESVHIKETILSKLNDFPQENLTVVIDAVQTLPFDDGNTSSTYTFLKTLQNLVVARSAHLLLHVVGPGPLIPLLTPTTFSSSLVYLKIYSISLFLHLSTEYLTPPPPASRPDKFWNLFIPISERPEESERLIYGPSGSGSGSSSEFIVEALSRHAGPSTRKRSLDRDLYGWSAHAGLCGLEELDGLRAVLKVSSQESHTTQETVHSTSFSLELTESQQKARANVPLPYAHEGKTESAIYYDYDSADDHDEDDPDEDLDI